MERGPGVTGILPPSKKSKYDHLDKSKRKKKRKEKDLSDDEWVESDQIRNAKSDFSTEVRRDVTQMKRESWMTDTFPRKLEKVPVAVEPSPEVSLINTSNKTISDA